MNRQERHINAFTIFEVTVVLAIMGVLIGLIAVSVNRFNEQLKMTGDVNQELNEWFAFRSNLWSELYTCDSITTQEGELLMYINGKTIKYKLDEDRVMRSTGFDWQETKANAESIRLEEVDENKTVVFDFHWKGELMTLSYYFEPDVNHKINEYFARLK